MEDFKAMQKKKDLKELKKKIAECVQVLTISHESLRTHENNRLISLKAQVEVIVQYYKENYVKRQIEKFDELV